MTNFRNPSSRHYLITDKIEAGVSLLGSEVKSIKTRGIQLSEAVVQVKEGNLYLVNAHIAPYQFATDRGYDPKRARKLLLKRKEIALIIAKKRAKLTLVPLSCYTKRGWIKILLGIGRKKKKIEKKQELIAKETKKLIRQIH